MADAATDECPQRSDGGKRVGVLRGDVVLVLDGAHAEVATYLLLDLGGGGRVGAVVPGRLDGLVGDHECQPLLRVHGLGLAARDGEEAVVERVGLVDEVAPVLGQLGLAAADLRRVEARGRHGADGRASPLEELPERLDVVGLGEAARHPDDGDLLEVVAVGLAAGFDGGLLGEPEGPGDGEAAPAQRDELDLGVDVAGSMVADCQLYRLVPMGLLAEDRLQGDLGKASCGDQRGVCCGPQWQSQALSVVEAEKPLVVGTDTTQELGGFVVDSVVVGPAEANESGRQLCIS